VKQLKVGDKVWWAWFKHGDNVFGRVEIFGPAKDVSPHHYILKPIKIYFDEAFSAEDDVPLNGVAIDRKHLFTDEEFNHLPAKPHLIISIFHYRWD
jgi:hypothetical protein